VVWNMTEGELKKRFKNLIIGVSLSNQLPSTAIVDRTQFNALVDEAKKELEVRGFVRDFEMYDKNPTIYKSVDRLLKWMQEYEQKWIKWFGDST
jgi:hypothetical protein